MGVYQIETAGGVYQVETQDDAPAAPADSAPEWGKGASGFLSGIADLVDFGQQVAPGGKMFGANPLNKDPSYGEAIRSGLDKLTGVKDSTRIGEGGFAHTAASYLPGVVIGPEKASQNAIQTALMSVGGGVGREVGGETGQLVGALLSLLGPKGVAMLAKGAGVDDALINAGKALERKSIGASYSDYLKTADDLQSVQLPSGDIESWTKSVLDDLIQRGELGKSRDAGKLAAVAAAKEDKLSTAIGGVIDDYEKNGGSKVFPTFDNALAYLGSGKVPADKIDQFFNRLVKKASEIKSEGKGSLKFLQQQKIAQGTLWDPNDTVLNGFDRAIYQDLQETIEKAAPAVGPLNLELSKWKTVAPILKRSLARSEGADVISKTKEAWRTTGGFGVPILLASKAAGAPGAAAAFATTALTTPAGQKFTGQMLGSAGQALSTSAFDVPTAARSVFAVNSARDNPSGARQSKSPEQTSAKLAESTPQLQAQEERRGTTSALENLTQTQSDSQPILARILDGIRQVESSGGKNVGPSSAGAKGPYQLLDSTGKEYHDKLGITAKYDPFDEEQSRLIAAAYLDDLLRMFQGDLEKALTAYHSGQGNVQKGKIGPIGRRYARSVFEAAA